MRNQGTFAFIAGDELKELMASEEPDKKFRLGERYQDHSPSHSRHGLLDEKPTIHARITQSRTLDRTLIRRTNTIIKRIRAVNIFMVNTQNPGNSTEVLRLAHERSIDPSCGRSYPDPGGHSYSYQQTSDPDPENPIVLNHNLDPETPSANHFWSGRPYTHADPGHNDPCSPVGPVLVLIRYHLYPVYSNFPLLQ
ncbi:hypothetical protein Tco_0017846 [Tanacetum coccineum]